MCYNFLMKYDKCLFSDTDDAVTVRLRKRTMNTVRAQ